MGSNPDLLVGDAIKPYFPDNFHWKESEKDQRVIPAFSSQTMKVFSEIKPGNGIENTFILMNKDVCEIRRLHNKLQTEEKNETRNKLLSILALSLSVGIVAAGVGCIIVGAVFPISWYMLIPVAAVIGGGIGLGASTLRFHYVFNRTKILNRRIDGIVKTNHIREYDNKMSLFVAENKTMANKIEKRIKKLDDENYKGKIEELEAARAEWEAISQIYKKQLND